MISKERFVYYIEKIRKFHEYEEELHSIPIKYGHDSDFYFPSLEDELVSLLDETFQNNKSCDVAYFIYELDFGKRYYPGVIRQNGNDIDISTAEKLYDFLIQQGEEENNE